MQKLRAFRYALTPTPDLLRKLACYIGSCRYVWNRALALQRDTRAAGDKHLSYPALCKHLTVWRNDPEMPWLAETPCCVLQQALKDLCTAYSNFFAKRADFPRLKRKGDSAAMRFPADVKLDQAGCRLCLPKLGWLRYRNSREIVGQVRSATVRFHAGRWFISILTLQEVEEPVHPSSTTAAIDLGVVRLATLSDGTVVPPFPPPGTARATPSQSPATDEPQSNVWSQLAQSKGPRRPHCGHPGEHAAGLLAQDHHGRQPRPQHRHPGGPEGDQHDALSGPEPQRSPAATCARRQD